MPVRVPKNANNTISGFLANHLKETRVHPRSLVSTFFGDIVMPNDGFTWLETLFSAVEGLGINDRLVRTTLYRMREEGWLDSTRAGRKSIYQLTEYAKRQTHLAERLIYHSELPAWDGSWTLVFLTVRKIDPEIRLEFIQELGWVGFGQVTKGVWAHPGASKELVGELVEQLNLGGSVICMRCENIQDQGLGLPIDDRHMAAMCMPVADIETNYNKFISTFSVVLDNQGRLNLHGSATEQLSLRLMLVDEFRRIILKDPHLPVELLPQGWAGFEAHRLCEKIYHQLFNTTNLEYQRLQSNAGTSTMAKAEPMQSPLYEQRFRVK